MNLQDVVRRQEKVARVQKRFELWNGVIGILLMVIILVCLPWTCKADEPWYYQTDADYRFMMPDKVQHFYGSYLLTLSADWPAAALCGVVKECMDAAAGHEFSFNDLVADGLGIASALLNHKAEIQGKSPRRFAAALDWRRDESVIIFFVKIKL